MPPIRPMLCAALFVVLFAEGASAKDRARPSPPPKLSCERAGDPVCDIGTEGASSLPTPSSRVIRQNEPAGYRVNDAVSVRGRSDFNADRYGGAIVNNPNPHPSSQDVNGGGAVNYRF